MYSNGETFVVIGNNEEPPTPLLTSSFFSGDGSFVSVSFDSPTDRAGVMGSSRFNCSSLFKFQGSDLASCQWSKDSMSVVLTPGPSVVIDVGAKVTILPGVLKASCAQLGQCANWKYVAASSVAVSPPATPTLPTVVISAPDAIGEEGVHKLVVQLTSA